jgi:hypothetical protein
MTLSYLQCEKREEYTKRASLVICIKERTSNVMTDCSAESRREENSFGDTPQWI